MILILLGPPGSGKGTQAKKLISEKKWPQLSTGDMLRSAIEKGTELGKAAKSYMDKGALVPDSVVIGLIQERTQLADCKNGYILDGFPRTIPQAQALDEMLHSQKKEIGRVVLFQIPDQELVRRLSGRRTCLKCGAMYHIETTKPQKEGVCDQCNSELVQRQDDQPQVIQKRLAVYHEQTAPVADYYQKKNKLKSINALESPEQVLQALNKVLTQ